MREAINSNQVEILKEHKNQLKTRVSQLRLHFDEAHFDFHVRKAVMVSMLDDDLR